MENTPDFNQKIAHAIHKQSAKLKILKTIYNAAQENNLSSEILDDLERDIKEIEEELEQLFDIP